MKKLVDIDQDSRKFLRNPWLRIVSTNLCRMHIQIRHYRYKKKNIPVPIRCKPLKYACYIPITYLFFCIVVFPFS